MNRRCFVLGLALMLTAGLNAQAISYDFQNIAGGDTVGDAYASWFKMDVTDAGSGDVLFMISNIGGGSIEQVFFDFENALLSDFAIDLANTTPWDSSTQQGVAFSVDGTPGNLPQGENISFSTDESVSADPPPSKKGVGLGETLGVSAQGTFASLISALDSGSFLVGLHVISLPTTDSPSDSYYNGRRTPETPVPDGGSTMLLMSLALFGIEFARRKLAAK